jgi:hypothetical protein
MRYLRRLTGFLCLFHAFFILVHSPAAADENAPRVLISPLTIHSEKDLTFLNNGIMEMMASRIGSAATVIRKIDPDPGKDPVQKARDLNADYVVSGSLTIFGDSVSTDVALTAVHSGDAALQFSRFGQSSSDVLGHINQFGIQAAQYLASQSPQPRVAAPAESAPAVMIPQVAPKVEPAPQPVAAPAPPAPTPAKVPPAPQPTTVEEKIEPLWTSNMFKGTIRALATGDVDGSGDPEIVYIHESKVVVSRKDGERLAAFDVGKRHNIIALDVGDINANGPAEIFVTRLDAHDKLDALVLEWNGTALQAIAEGQNWYFRVGGSMDKDPLLMGQRRGAPAANDTGGLYEDSHFLPGVFELSRDGSDYRAGRRISLPGEMTIYRFAKGDIFNDGQKRAIAYSASDELRIYDPAGSLQWAGQESLGGSPFYLESVSATDARTKDRAYLTQRFILADLDGDGTTEVVTVHNRDAARGFVERFRKYTRGRVVALRWNKVNMKQIWKGEEISGFISDFSLADLDGDGRPEAIYAMVVSTGLTQTRSSNIVVERIGELSDK